MGKAHGAWGIRPVVRADRFHRYRRRRLVLAALTSSRRRRAGASRPQLPRRNPALAGVCRAVVRPGVLHGRLHRGDRPGRDSVREQRAGGSRARARPQAHAGAPAGRLPSSPARDHPPPDQPVSQPRQELQPGGRHWLSRFVQRRRDHLQPDRPRAGDHRPDDVQLSDDEPDDLAAAEYLQPPRAAGGAMTTLAAPETLRPPRASVGVLGWLRQNLFSTWYNALLTLVTLWLLYALLRPASAWILTEAQWEVVTANLRLFMVGQYPAGQWWRIWLCVYALGLLAGLSWGTWGARFRTFAVAIGSP